MKVKATKQRTLHGRKRGTAIHAGSGNVFADLGLPDADERLAKAELARQLRALITAAPAARHGRGQGKPSDFPFSRPSPRVRGWTKEVNRCTSQSEYCF